MPFDGAKNLDAKVGSALGGTTATCVSDPRGALLAEFLRTLALSCATDRWHRGANDATLLWGLDSIGECHLS